jgi:hypothetical protein
MIVLCNFDRLSSIPSGNQEVDKSESTQFFVTLGRKYFVYAMGQNTRNYQLKYYLSDEEGNLDSYPSDLFEIVDGTLPRDWGFAEWKSENYHYRIWGYKEILKYDHFEGLIEHRQNDKRVFANARKRIEDQFLLNGESELLKELCETNSLLFDESRIQIWERKLEKDRMQVYLLAPDISMTQIDLTGNNMKTLSRKIKGTETKVECFFIKEKDRLVGIEYFCIAGQLPDSLLDIAFQ